MTNVRTEFNWLIFLVLIHTAATGRRMKEGRLMLCGEVDASVRFELCEEDTATSRQLGSTNSPAPKQLLHK